MQDKLTIVSIKGVRENPSFHVIMSETATSDNDSRYQGRVKWFNNKAGYGFVTVVGGESDGKDIFAHHSGVIVQEEQYKYLVQGEYVAFKLTNSNDADHPDQATEVTGIGGGLLMCETRTITRKQREAQEDGDMEGQQTRPPRRRVRGRGGGPREGAGGGEGWKMSRETGPPQRRRQRAPNSK